MDGNGSFSVLTYVEELPDDGVVWSAPVHEEQVVVLEAGLGEAFGVVHLLVESDDGRDVVFPKVWDVRLRGVQRVPLRRGEKVHVVSAGAQIGSENHVQRHLPFSILLFG